MPITINDCKYCGLEAVVYSELDFDRDPRFFITCRSSCEDGAYFKDFADLIRTWNELNPTSKTHNAQDQR